MRQPLSLLLLIVFALCAPLGWNKAKGPSARQLCRSLLSEPQSSPGLAAAAALSQPFAYWSKGSQSYVFLSQDGRYVLKIPRLSKMKESLLQRVFERRRKRTDLLKSLKIAGEFLAPETALVYAHYGRASLEIPKEFALQDRFHCRLNADLADLPFALQMRRELLSSALLKADLAEAKRILTAYLDLIGEEKEKGWMGRDRAFLLNFGYDNNRAVRIDVGSYVPLSSGFSWHLAAKPVLRWLQEREPALCSWFDEELSKRE